MSQTAKALFSGAAIALTFTAFVPYIRAVSVGDVKPHMFSWIVWGVTTLIVFVAQVGDRAGVGAWPIGVSAVITLSIAVLAYFRRADVSITKADWWFFLSALASIPLWYLTADALAAVSILTAVDVLGFGPTLRKAYRAPHAESLAFFSLFALRNLAVVLALENYTATTVLFPAVVGTACLGLVVMIAYRRRTCDERPSSSL